MFHLDRWSEIFETIKSNKLRTFLAGFTVALGILIFVVLFGLGNGLQNTFDEYFTDTKFNNIYISGGRTSKPFAGYESNRLIELDNDDLQDISEKFNFFIDGLTPRISISGEVGYKLKSNNYTISGVGPSNQDSEMNVLMFGRYINESDVLNNEKNIVLGLSLIHI